MGLDIGILVKKEDGIRLKNNLNLLNIDKELFDFISKNLPNSGIMENDAYIREVNFEHYGNVWDFCIHLKGRGMKLEEAGYETKNVYETLFSFIYDKISFNDFLTLEVYYSG